MDALNSAVKTIWIVMLAFVVVGWLLSDRVHVISELQQANEQNTELRNQLEQERNQSQAYAVELENALRAEQQARQKAEQVEQERNQWQAYAVELEKTLREEQQARQNTEQINKELAFQAAVLQHAVAADGRMWKAGHTDQMADCLLQLSNLQNAQSIYKVPAQLVTANALPKATIGILIAFGLGALLINRYYLSKQNQKTVYYFQTASGKRIKVKPLILRPIRWSESIRSTPVRRSS
jgi:hypothetical protein